MSDETQLVITQGKTLDYVIRWETAPVKRVPITGISFATGAPRLTAVAHGIPDGWRAYVIAVSGPSALNADTVPPGEDDFYQVTVVDADTVELNEVDPVDDRGRVWPAYASGGFLCYNTPVDLTGYTGRAIFRDKIGGTALLSLTTENDGMIIDPADYTIRLVMDADDAAAIAWKKSVFEVEVESSTGYVPPALLFGEAVVKKELAT